MLKENLKKVLYCFISVLLFIILFFLSAQSLFTEVKLDDGERKYFIASNKALVILLFFLLLAFFYAWHKYVRLSDKAVKRIIIIMAVFNFLFILASQNLPRSDQDVIMKCAAEILHGNYRRLEFGSYLYMAPHQKGLVFFCYFISLLLGEYNFLAFQMINLLAVGFTYYLLYHYLDKYAHDGRKDEIILGVMLFLPIMFYTNYVYGLLIGLMSASCAMLYQQMYFKTRDNKKLLLSILFIALAYMFKTNYAIFAVAIVLLYFVDAWDNCKSMIGIAGVIAALLLTNVVINTGLSVITNGVSDEYKGDGIPMIAYLVMGVDSQDGGYGWFNSYNWAVYTNNDYDYEKTQNACMEDLKNEIQYQLDNPQVALDFFQKKLTSIWCEASFGSFYEMRIDYQTVLHNHSHLYNDTFADTGRLHRILALFLEVYQSLIYIGVIFYLIFSRKEYALLKLAGLIVFLGGFIFHTFWEAKSSYIFAYFVLLIPYAIMGLRKCFDNITKDILKEKTGGIKAAALLAGFVVLVVSGSALAINENEEEWLLFLAEHRFINEGCYHLQSKAADENARLGEYDKWVLNIDMDYVWKYTLLSPDKKNRLADIDGGLRMVSDEEADAILDENGDSAKWRFERVGGAYCIRWWLDMNKVLTYDAESGTLYVSDYEAGNENQLWELRR
ncbi:MAG: hypothetical protein NC321_07020 [Clostridium sp.]|nr:hypothetical protein [Clostridium sp.]